MTDTQVTERVEKTIYPPVTAKAEDVAYDGSGEYEDAHAGSYTITIPSTWEGGTYYPGEWVLKGLPHHTDGPPMVPTVSIAPLLIKGKDWVTTHISVGPPEFYWSSEVAVLIKGEGWDKRRYVLVPAMGPATPPEAPRVVPIRRLRDLTPERLKSILDKEMPGWDVPTPALLAPKGALYAKRHPILWKGRLVYDRYERKHRVPRFYRTQQPVSYISYKDLPRLVEADEARLEREYSTEHEKFTRALRERPHLVQCYGVGNGHPSYIHTHRTAERAFKCRSGFLWRVRGADPFVTPDRTYLKPVADTLRRKLEVRRLSPEKSYMRPFATPLREMLASMKFAEEEDLQPHKAFKTEKDRIVQAMRDLCSIDVWDSKPFVDYAYSSISAQKAATTLKRKRGDCGPIKVANYYENVLRSAYDYTRAVHPGRGITVGELAKVLVRERKYRVNTKPSGVRPPTEVTIGNVEGASIAALKGSWRPAGALERSTLEFIFQGEELPLRFLARTAELGVQSKKTCRKTFGLLPRIRRTMDYLTWPDLYRSVRAEVSPPKSKRTHSKHPKLLTRDMLGRSGEGSDTPVYALPDTIPNTKGDYFADGAPKLSGRPGILYTRPTRLRPRKVHVKDEESRGRVVRPADPASVVVAYTVYEDAQIPEQIHSYSVPSVIQARVREAARSARDYPLTMPYIDTAEVPERVKPVATMANPARWRQKEAGIVRAHPPRSGATDFMEAPDLVEVTQSVEGVRERPLSGVPKAATYEEAEEAAAEVGVSIFEEGDQEGTRVDLDTEDVDLADEGDDEASDHLMTLKLLDATLQMMISEKEYRAVRLAYVDGLGTASGASEMGISPTTFQTHIRNARRKIEAHGGTLPNRDRGYTAAA